MNCSFCHRPSDDFQCANALTLCPECLHRLLSVSPDDREYAWFVSAVRRSLISPASEAARADSTRALSANR